MSDAGGQVTALVEADSLCSRCGYNLRGLMSDGRCPECGADIASSLRGDLLRYADREWLRRVQSGIRLNLWNILIFCVSLGASLIFSGPTAAWLTAWSFVILRGAVALVAATRITAAEPRIAGRESQITLRRFVRICFAVTLGALLLRFIDGARSPWIVQMATWILSSAAQVVGLFAELLYLRRFANRIPDDRLAKSTTRMMWLASASLAIVHFLQPYVVAPLPGGTLSASDMLRVCFVMVIGVSMIVVFIFYVLLMFQYNAAFRDALAGSGQEERALEVDLA